MATTRSLTVCLVSLSFALCALGTANAQTHYSLTDLGFLQNESAPGTSGGNQSGTPGTGTRSFGIALNNAGHVTGEADSDVAYSYPNGSGGTTSGTSLVFRSLLYTGSGFMQDLGALPLPPGYASTNAYYQASWGQAINGSDDVAGGSQAAELINGTYQLEVHAALWKQGQAPVDLGAKFNALYPNNNQANQLSSASYALGINDAGQVVGYGFDYSNGNNVGNHAFLYDEATGTITDLDAAIYAGVMGDLSTTGSKAAGINSAGQIVGVLYYDNQAFSYNGYYPFVYDTVRHTTTVLLSKYGSASAFTVYGTDAIAPYAAINSRGDVAFTGYEPGTNTETAILYKNGTYTDLGAEPDSQGVPLKPYSVSAIAINDSDQVVGNGEFATDSSGNPVPTGSVNAVSAAFFGVLWQGGTMYPLAQITAIAPGERLSDVRGINSAGQIAAIISTNGGVRAVLLTPGFAYTVTDLGAIPTGATGDPTQSLNAINDYGQIVGDRGLWTPDTPNGTASATGFVGLGLTEHNGINAAGQVAGQADAAMQDRAGSEIFAAAVWTPSAPNTNIGTIAGLGVLGTSPVVSSTPPISTNFVAGVLSGSSALDVNASHRATGWSTTARNIVIDLHIENTTMGTETMSIYNDILNGFVGSPGAAPTLSPLMVGTATPLDNGVLGSTASGGYFDAGFPNGQPGGYIFPNNGVLVPAAGLVPGPTAINASGQLAGWANSYYTDSTNTTPNDPYPDFFETTAYLFDPVAGFTAIPSLDAAQSGEHSSAAPNALAYSINDRGDIAGQSESSVGYGYLQHGFLRQANGNLIDLGALTGTYKPLVLVVSVVRD